MSYFGALSDDETTGSTLLAELNDRTKRILAKQESAERWREWQAIVAVAGSVFAAVRLGIIALPQVRELSRRRALGSLGAPPTSNPARRRQRQTRRR